VQVISVQHMAQKGELCLSVTSIVDRCCTLYQGCKMGIAARVVRPELYPSKKEGTDLRMNCVPATCGLANASTAPNGNQRGNRTHWMLSPTCLLQLHLHFCHWVGRDQLLYRCLLRPLVARKLGSLCLSMQASQQMVWMCSIPCP
jgi:hypothetical protein